MNTTLRFTLLAAFGAASLAAQAQITYDFKGTGALGDAYSFSFTTPTYLASQTSVPSGGLSALSHVDRALFAPDDGGSDRLSVAPYDFSSFADQFYFTKGAFDANGDYGTTFGNAGTLTVSGTPQAVPEPATIAALGLGALSLLRRRRTTAWSVGR